MITSPIMVLSALYIALVLGSIYFQHVGQIAVDKADGNVYSEAPRVALMEQSHRANRTAAWMFGLSFIVSMFLVGTMEFPY